jgi:16S rRNA G527 N7-methylase RsmG
MIEPTQLYTELSKLNFAISEQAKQKIEAYTQLLLKWNKAYNLIAKEDEK